MSVTLLAIKFNHDPTSARNDAFNIRQDVDDFVTVPEWRRGFSVRPRDSVAAYAIEETRGRTITIQAQFGSTDAFPSVVEIRAMHPRAAALQPEDVLRALGSPRAWPSFAQYMWYANLLWRRWSSPDDNVLGNVSARQVNLRPGRATDFVTFNLESHHLWRLGVGAHDVTWRWQFRRSSAEPWQDFAESTHRIFTTLRLPTAPWLQQPYEPGNTQLPWTDVLDYACRWARGAQTQAAAATGVTNAVYNLGPTVVQYNCPGQGAPNYILITPFDAFKCTAFIGLLRGEPFRPPWVNCADCAAVVTSFSNILGCDLTESGMFNEVGTYFATNPIRVIGSFIWQLPCGTWPGFAYHEVAWTGDVTEEDNVFDACLLVNGSANPTRAPFVPLLPANLRYGRPGQGLYRDRLIAPAFRATTVPVLLAPALQRRIVI
ncbi:MAG TPA: hypothetical protein VGV59_01705 [Pyrinomonadaceae bacterium]|nr:hypothetical protein [Pyrinomonadaceae bacterium]